MVDDEGSQERQSRDEVGDDLRLRNYLVRRTILEYYYIDVYLACKYHYFQ